MKKLKLNLQDLNAEVLTRSQLKQILGGDDGSGGGSGGNCQSHGEKCATHEQLNCCSGLVCADYKCAYVTLAAK